MSEQPRERETGAVSRSGSGPSFEGLGASRVAGRYEIDTAAPLADLADEHTPAFRAFDTRDRGRALFVRLHGPRRPPRGALIMKLAKPEFEGLALQRPLAGGLITLGETARRYAVVFEQPRGARFLADPTQSFAPLSEKSLLAMLFKPLVPVLRAFAQRGLTHRAISIANLYYGDETATTLALGDCVSGRPGLAQPTLYETLAGACAQPSGRGEGTPADDLFALGVLAAHLLLGRDPASGRSEIEMNAARIEAGSCAAILGKTRLSHRLQEVLRGLLADRPADRWTIEDLEHWLDGKQLSPRQPTRPRRAARAFRFGDRDHWTAMGLSYALGLDWAQAGGTIVEGSLGAWYKHSSGAPVDDQESEIIDSPEYRQSHGEDHVIARVLISLAPSLPLRYREVSARFDAVFQAYAMDFHDLERRRTWIALIKDSLPQAWLARQGGTLTDTLGGLRRFEEAAASLGPRGWGSGGELLLYRANPTWPCQSPLLAEDYVADIVELLPALERVAKRADAKATLFESHLIAFTIARLGHPPDRLLKDLDDQQDPARRSVALLELLRTIERRSETRTCPALATWLVRHLEPAVSAFHNRPYRRALAEALAQACAKGDLAEMLRLVESKAAQRQDQEGFALAGQGFRRLNEERAWLEGGGLIDGARVRAISDQLSCTIAGSLAVVGLVALALHYFL